MSMLREGSVIISGGTFETRQGCLVKILESPKIFDEVETLIRKAPAIDSISTKKSIPENDPDIVTLSHEKEKIGVGDVRNFVSLLQKKPISRDQKIGVIIDAEKMTTEAQNALLKTLEEPPVSCAIFLAVPHPKDLLATILSRCLIVNLGNPTTGDTKTSARKISSLSVGEKFALAQKVGSTRQSALEFLDNLFIELHQSLPSLPQKVNYHFEKIRIAKKIISGNGNVRLTLENLFLDW